MSAEEALTAVRGAAQGYEVFGTMIRAAGGAPVYFARDLSGGHLVALRLEQESGPGQEPEYTITANRMMRPKLLYGAIGGKPGSEAQPSDISSPPAWTPIPSPPIPMRPATSSAAGSGPLHEKMCPQCNQTFAPELRLCPHDGSALRAKPSSDELIGRVIADRYNIVGKLGQGGMGTVYLAEHVRMGRRCAVKVMNPILLNDPDSLDRFTREAKNASMLNHPHVAAIYDFGETADGIIYLAMEFVEGESLAAVLGRMHGLPEQQALELGSQVADALGAAHEIGIVHRDLKPDNIMLCQSKTGTLRVKVVDFGIAKAMQGSSQTVTRTGYVVGTPAYMSPEQILGDPLDGRSDLYSLGCILYEMLTGERAFTSPSGEVSIRRRLTEPPPRPRSVKQTLSKSLDGIVTKAMARAPEQRFHSAGDLRRALLAVLDERPRKDKWPAWLPWGHAEASAPEDDRISVVRTPDVFRQASLPSPAPFVAASSVDSLPGQDWSTPPSGQTRLRHRSARSESSQIASLMGRMAAAVFVAVSVYFVAGGKVAGVGFSLSDMVGRSGGSDSRATSGLVSEPIDLPLDGPDTARSSSPPPPVPAMIRFDSTLPPGSRVTIDSIEVRPSAGGLLMVEPGPRQIGVRAPGFRRMRTTATAVAGETTSVHLELTRLPPKPVAVDTAAADTLIGAIVVPGSLPPGAVIRVNGRMVEPGVKVLTVVPGTHWVALSAPGYATDSSQVVVEQGSWADWSPPDLIALPPTTSEESSDSAPAAESESRTDVESGDSLPQPQ
jgi:serine/threonine protein kinase